MAEWFVTHFILKEDWLKYCVQKVLSAKDHGIRIGSRNMNTRGAVIGYESSDTEAGQRCPSHPFAMPFATPKNTSPVSALLRAMAMSDEEQVRAGSVDCNKKNCDDAVTSSKLRAMLKPLDDWMRLPNENQKSNILTQSVLVTSLGLTEVKDEIQEIISVDGSSVKHFLGEANKKTFTILRFHILTLFIVFAVNYCTKCSLNQS